MLLFNCIIVWLYTYNHTNCITTIILNTQLIYYFKRKTFDFMDPMYPQSDLG